MEESMAGTSDEYFNGKESDRSIRISENNIWNSASSFFAKLDNYFKEETNTDVNIICQNRVFKCHRIVLATASEYFQRMFDGNFLEGRAPDVVLRTVDSVTFEQILHFVYKGKIVTIDKENVYNLLRASDLFRLKAIKDLCVRYLTHEGIPLDHALELYLFASSMDEASLIPTTAQFLLRHLDHFYRESEFLKMPFDYFSALLTYYQDSCPTREETLLNAIFRWVCGSPDVRDEDRKSAFTELTQKVRFKSIVSFNDRPLIFGFQGDAYLHPDSRFVTNTNGILRSM